MLQLAGFQMDTESPMHWKQMAHETALYLTGSQIFPEQASFSLELSFCADFKTALCCTCFAVVRVQYSLDLGHCVNYCHLKTLQS